jgi:hypothetical protein
MKLQETSIRKSSTVETFRPELTPGESIEKNSFFLHYVIGLSTSYSQKERKNWQ